MSDLPNLADLVATSLHGMRSNEGSAPRSQLKPFVRYMGSKWRIRNSISGLLAPTPLKMYCEPFLGGGAIFWHLWNLGLINAGTHVILNDANPALMRLWQSIKLHGPGVLDDLAPLRAAYDAAPEETYYAVRTRWNAQAPIERTAVDHLFLRAACFNGLWRENSKGEMNAPWRRERKLSLPTRELLAACQQALTQCRASLMSTQAELAIESALAELGARDGLVYLDPPYLETETKYLAGGFTLDDATALIRFCAQRVAPNTTCLLSNNNIPTVRELLVQHWPTAQIHELMAPRSISCDATTRVPAREIVAYQYGMCNPLLVTASLST